ncbi:MAG: malate dehydrogenase [Solirubrobacteraceae bacterium]
MRSKITVVGAGNVGATVAQRLAERDYADLVLVDVEEGLAQGKALDLNQAGLLTGYEPNLIARAGYEETGGSDIVVVTSGRPRGPDMSRDDLLGANREIVSEVCGQVAERSPDAVVIVVTNPLDAMCHVALEATGFPRQRVIGMAGILDSARLRTFLAWELGVSTADVSGLVLGGHGDTMVPVLSKAQVGGSPIRERLSAQRLEEIVQRTRDGGAEVVELLGDGSAFYGPSAAIAEMVDAIVLDRKRVLVCTALCQGEYGAHDLFIGVPVKLGKDGVEEIVEIALEDDERTQLRRSADAVREVVEALARL